MNFLPRPRSELWQLLALAGVTLALPLFLPADPAKASVKKIAFDQERFDKAARRNPHVVLLGNSMLNSRVSKPLFNDLIVPNIASYVAEGGTRSTVWWFMLKNFVGPLKTPPKVVFILYRDYDFTSPGMHLDGNYLDVARTFMKPDDEELLATAKKSTGADTHPLLDYYLPDKLTQNLRSKLSEVALDVGAVGQGKRGDNHLQENLNNLFDFDNLRANVFDAGAAANDIVPADTRIFSVDPANSFLALFNDFAKQRGIRLVFYRVKRRPDEKNQVAQDPDLKAYTQSFREWAESQGHVLIDETEDPRIVLSMYHDGDHLGRAAMAEYTHLFVERIKDLLPFPLANPPSALAPVPTPTPTPTPAPSAKP